MGKGKARALVGEEVKPLTYEEVEAIVKSGQREDLGKLRRIYSEQQRYDTFIAKVKSEYCTVEDYILHKVFGVEKKVQQDSGKWACQTATSHQQRLLIWRENDFPYALESGLKHYILWSTETLKKEDIETEIEAHVPTTEYLYFVNPPKFRSIERVWHAHVLFKEVH